MPHTLERSVSVSASRERVWGWLCDPRTFTQGNLPPWRVEFVAERAGGPVDFTPGVFTNHHGPGINFPAIIREVNPPEFRSMEYLYGSYAISLRLIRPTWLTFRLEAIDGGTRVQVRLDSYVRSWFAPFWTVGQSIFWWSFLSSAKILWWFKR